MNITSKSIFKRLVTLLLVIVMVAGMLPSTASADITGGSTSGTFPDYPPSGEGGGGSWPNLRIFGRFTRYTLVYFPFSDNTEHAGTDVIPADQWLTKGEIIGAIDVITETNMEITDEVTYLSDTKGNLSTAFQYRQSTTSAGISMTGARYKDLMGTKVFDSSQILGGEHLNAYPTFSHINIKNYDGGDPLCEDLMVPDDEATSNSNAPIYAPNVTLNDILQKIYAASGSSYREDLKDTSRYNGDKNKFMVYNQNNSNIKSAAEWESQGIDCSYVYNFIDGAIDGNRCYRLLAEPGIIMDAASNLVGNGSFKPAALTLRDISSIVLHQPNSITDHTRWHGTVPYDGCCEHVGGSWKTAVWDMSHQFWFIFGQYWYFMRHAFGLANDYNAFRTFTPKKEGDKITGVDFNETWDQCFSKVKASWLDTWAAHHSVNVTSIAGNDNWHSMYSLSMATMNDFNHQGEGTHAYGMSRIEDLGTWEWPSFGLAIIEPASMLPSIEITTDEITVKKVVAGDKAADLKAFRSTYEFEVSIPASTYDTLVTAGVTFSDKDSGTSINFTEDGGNRIYAFTLTDGAQKTIKLDNIPESISGTVNDWFNATITEKDVDTLYDHFKDNDPPFALYINESSTKDDDGVIENVKLGSTTVFKNQLGGTPTPGEGTLHVIVDYNLPGAYASSDPGEPNDLTKENMLDCGIHPAGEVVELALTAKGTALNNIGVEVPGIADKVHFKFNGLSLKPDSLVTTIASNNGEILGSDGNVYRYRLPDNVGDKEELLILYVLWDITVDPPTPDPDPDPDPTPTPGPSPTTNVYTVYWDMGAGFDGGGITSQTCGQIVIPALNLTATASCGCGTGTARAQRDKIKIDFGFDPPDIDHALSQHRMGCWFIGWLPHDASSGTNYNYLGFVGTSMQCEVYNEGNTILGRLLVNGEDWLPYINDHPEAPGKSTTYHAIWVGHQYSFDANGGYYPTKSDRTHEGVTYEGIPEDSTEGKGILKGLPDYDGSWFGDFVDNDGNTRAHRLKCATVRQNANGCWDAWYVPRIEPIRTGYTFTGWYWDPQCSVPVTRNEEGFIPGRIYFAGWEAEPVYVTYYDTREGNSVVTVQKYNYDDMIKLSDKMSSTIGWTFSGWGAPNLPVRDKANEAEPEPPTQDSMGNFVESMEAMGRFVPTILDVGILTCHDGRYEDGNGGGNAHGSPENLEDMTGEGQGVISGKHYWTLDLYSLWNQETADYVATFHFNDYNNNDGARPTELTVGIVDSITNREVTTTKVVVDPDKEVFTKTVATGLAMTNNNASTERVKYYMYLKDYTDIDGQTFTIQNTSASTGEIALASVSNADTSPMASYRYTINQVNTGNVTDQPNIDGGNDGLYTGTMYFDHNLMTTGDDVEFTIRWNDQSDNDGMRPETLKLTLMGRTNGGAWKRVEDWVSPGNGMFHDQYHQSNSGVVYINSGICNVSDDGNVWTYIFKDFQKYDNRDYIEYAVKVEGYQEYAYTASTTGYVEDGIVLSYEPVKAPVPVDIYWHDNTNQDGMRPDSVVVQLIAHQWNRDLGAYESVVVNAKRFTGFSPTANLWSSSFDNMPVYHDGQPILYHLVVTSDLNGNMDDDSNPYTWSEGISGSPYKDGARPSVDIYHNADERSVTATVQWDDMLNNDGKRPDSVTLQLYANNEPVHGDEYCVVLTGDPKALTWTYTFDHLDVYTNKRTGQEIIYKVKIIDAQGGEFESYTPSYINKYGAFVETFGASGEAFVLMSYKPKTGTVSGAVYWQDDNNRDGERPEFDKWRLTALIFFAIQREHVPLRENSGSDVHFTANILPFYGLLCTINRPCFHKIVQTSVLWPIIVRKWP